MFGNQLLSSLFCLAIWVIASPGQAQEPKRSVAELVGDLKKGEKEQLRALQDLEALGDKAAEAAQAVVDLLQAKSEDVRLQATLTLGKIGRPAVEPLTKALQSMNADVRFYAVWGLAFVGPPARSAAPAVVKALEDKSAQVRRKAAYALGRIDAEPESVVAALVAALADGDDDVRQAAGEALPKMGKVAVPALTTALESDKANLRNVAIKLLGDIGSAAESAIPQIKAFLLDPSKGSADPAASALAAIGAPAVAALTTAAADDNAAVRALALRSLAQIGVPAVPSLVDLLGAKHVDVRRLSANVLGSIPVNDKSVVVALGFATKDKDFEVRRSALGALRSRGAGAKLAEPYISALLIDIDPTIRQEAFHTLQGLGVDPRPGLRKALSNTDPAVRINTASLMTALNLEVDLAEPILLEGLKHKDSTLKMQAAHALSLRGLQGDVVLPIFVEGLKHDVPSVRRQAAEIIARYGPKARKLAGPGLLAALDDADDSVRAQALGTLRQVGAEPKALFPAMIKVLKKKDDPLHAAAAQVVFQVGPEAVGEIVAFLKNEDAPALRLTCLQTLAMVGPPAKEAVDVLTKALTDPAPRARMAAARALGNIGPDAKTAVGPLFKAARNDDDANVQKVARAALAQIQVDPKQKEFQVQGVLTQSDPFDPVRKGYYHVVHTYPMKTGQTYTINLTSTGWDNYLRLESPQGQPVAADDDSGGNLNARIIYRCPQDGWHRIIVTSFSPGASGNYTLKVN